uniref:glycerophosphodiester phosphodiesterase n=2 Tax=Hordeum vulgare subsp. vulgare TaxID=112509 RepID=A0A8I6WHV1_HORVV
MASLWIVVAAAVLVLGCASSGATARPLVGAASAAAKQPLQTSRPYNIAHRGSNGELPEETAVAYMRAIDEGADFIESDIVATKDGHLVCFHDMTLDDTTDVADHKEFAARRRTLEVQWANVTGYFITDFTLAELKTLRMKQRWSFRDKSHDGISPIITFDEFINIALNAKRVVGIYPEMKSPVFINQHVKWADGKKYEDKFIATLKKYGYGGKYMTKRWTEKPVFIQSFAPTSLIYAADLTDSPKVFLIDDVTVRTEDTDQSYEEITSDEYLDYMREYVVGIGPWKDTVVPPTRDNKLATPTDMVAMAHARGLQVHPYTYRNENRFLHYNFRQDPYAEYDYWLNSVGVDGLFTDFPASLRLYQDWTAAKN